MTYSPNVSIIMPIYNAERSLNAAIESVRAQSFTSWELILVDDGSTDKSYHIAQAIAEADKRIRLYRQPNNGPSRARNAGIERSTSEIIAFLDADDRWRTDRLAQMLSALDAMPKAGVLFSRTQFFDAASGQLGTTSPHKDKLTPSILLAENPVCSTSNIICRRSVLEQIGSFRDGLDFAEDQDWLLRVALDGRHEIRGVDAVSFYYASGDHSQSSDLEAMHAGWLEMADDAALAHAETIGRLRAFAYARFLRYLARRALRMRRGDQAFSYILRALYEHPSLIFKQPKRTALTFLGALLSVTRIRHLQELAAQ